MRYLITVSSLTGTAHPLVRNPRMCQGRLNRRSNRTNCWQPRLFMARADCLTLHPSNDQKETKRREDISRPFCLFLCWGKLPTQRVSKSYTLCSIVFTQYSSPTCCHLAYLFFHPLRSPLPPAFQTRFSPPAFSVVHLAQPGQPVLLLRLAGTCFSYPLLPWYYRFNNLEMYLIRVWPLPGRWCHLSWYQTSLIDHAEKDFADLVPTTVAYVSPPSPNPQ